ncbi:hypothetical protein [Christiangramia fulva]|uniref:hypothetical protein n=1 Tax=Christiangramia fulva TaxID=2126553 RepID=UPI001D053D75|nr:hypothetical protein [Christiangramia fulva]
MKFKIISTGTPRLRTESNGKLFGGMNGTRYESKRANAAIEFRIKMNLSKMPSLFI